MRIIKYEKIYLSQNEVNTWENFEKILEGLKRGCECPDTINLIQEIQCYLNTLWEGIEDIE